MKKKSDKTKTTAIGFEISGSLALLLFPVDEFFGSKLQRGRHHILIFSR